MTGPYGGGKQRDRLLGELLADLEPLGRRERHRAGTMMGGLFTVDLSPLGLMTGGEQWGPGRHPHDLNRTPRPRRYVQMAG